MNKYFKKIDALNEYEEYFGIEEVYNFLNEFFDEIDYENYDSEIEKICVYINSESKNVECKVFNGQLTWTAEDLIFSTKFIPVKVEPHNLISRDEFKKHLEHVYKVFINEFNKILEENENPIVITDVIAPGKFLAYSIMADEFLNLENLNFENMTFRVSNQTYEMLDPEGYNLVFLSRKLADLTGLTVNVEMWNEKNFYAKIVEDNLWMPKEIALNNLKAGFLLTYKKAAIAINVARVCKKNHFQVFQKLERRMYRLETFIKLCAPEDVIEREVILVEKALNDVIVFLKNN